MHHLKSGLSLPTSAALLPTTSLDSNILSTQFPIFQGRQVSLKSALGFHP